ncbi:hypothetical protein RRG08_063466 [Elysia crispata]|uniref:Uncharacterized protein n=1 Tax=Elysia crispata TaxID=231223 RepID=A0AAE1AA66_9GAST|nr:hypothetical protein RRG08_063466 [Elysia crispata]
MSIEAILKFSVTAQDSGFLIGGVAFGDSGRGLRDKLDILEQTGVTGLERGFDVGNVTGITKPACQMFTRRASLEVFKLQMVC